MRTTINLPIQTISMDSHGKIVAAKSHSGMILGWNVDELIGQEVSQTLVPEHLRLAHLTGMAAVTAGSESKLANKRVPLDALHRDGHMVPIDLIILVDNTTAPPIFTGMILSRQAGVQDQPMDEPDILPVLNVTWQITIDLFPHLPKQKTTLDNATLTTIRDAATLTSIIGETAEIIDDDVTDRLTSGKLKRDLLTPEVSMGIAKLLANPQDEVHFMECRTGENGKVYWTEVFLTVLDHKYDNASSNELHIQHTNSNLSLHHNDSINPVETTRLIAELHNIQITTMAHWISHRINNHLTALTLIFDIMDRNSNHKNDGLISRGASSCNAIAQLVSSMSDTVGLSQHPSEDAPLPTTIQQSIVRMTSGRISTAPISLANESKLSQSILIDAAFADQLIGSICHLLAPRMGTTSISVTITDRYTLEAGRSHANCHISVVLHDAAFPLSETDNTNSEDSAYEDSSQFGDSVHMGDILTEPHLALAVVEKVCVSNNTHFSWSIDVNRCVLEVQFDPVQEIAATVTPLSKYKSTKDSIEDTEQRVRYPSAVIIVEDELTVGRSICDALAKTNIRCYLAGNSHDAYTLLREHSDIEAAICDIVLGAEDGTSVATQMRQMMPSLRIVYMTGWAGHHRDVNTLQAMGNIVLFKPLDLKKLLKTIRSAY